MAKSGSGGGGKSGGRKGVITHPKGYVNLAPF